MVGAVSAASAVTASFWRRSAGMLTGMVTATRVAPNSSGDSGALPAVEKGMVVSETEATWRSGPPRSAGRISGMTGATWRNCCGASEAVCTCAPELAWPEAWSLPPKMTSISVRPLPLVLATCVPELEALQG